MADHLSNEHHAAGGSTWTSHRDLFAWPVRPRVAAATAVPSLERGPLKEDERRLKDQVQAVQASRCDDPAAAFRSGRGRSSRQQHAMVPQVKDIVGDKVQALSPCGRQKQGEGDPQAAHCLAKARRIKEAEGQALALPSSWADAEAFTALACGCRSGGARTCCTSRTGRVSGPTGAAASTITG